MVTINKESAELITDTLEDTVSYLCEELYREGEPISGESVYKLISAFSEAKLAEFRGEFG